MKRFLLTALCALFVCCLAIGAISCNTSHTHAYTEQVVSDKYLATNATCQKKATYYYSCECGQKGSDTFEYGDTLPHTFDQQIASEDYLATPATGTKRATYYYSCVCGAKGTETFEAGETRQIEIKLYVDGEYFASAFTDASQGYRLVSPKKPEDVTTNPNSKMYFDCWYVDENCFFPLNNHHKFTADSSIYGRLVPILDSFSFNYRVEDGKAYITGLNGGYDDT